MEDSGTSRLTVADLAIGYGRRIVVRSVDFSLGPGQLCGIVGVNGIGKSTLLRTLAGFQPKLSGRIILGDKALEGHSAAGLSRKLSVVLTEPPASGNLRVGELIALGRQPYTNWLGQLSPRDREAVGHSLEALKLQDLTDRKCHELSDGQLQRVLIARAMAQDTPLILLDEPTTHLDLYHKVQILKMLRLMAHDRDKTILFTTHEIELAIQLCDRILILDGGDNAYGPPCTLIEKGHFGRLFPADMVRFDPETGSFKVKK